MYCPKCGMEAPDNSVNCPTCGYKLIEDNNEKEEDFLRLKLIVVM